MKRQSGLRTESIRCTVRRIPHFDHMNTGLVGITQSNVGDLQGMCQSLTIHLIFVYLFFFAGFDSIDS